MIQARTDPQTERIAVEVNGSTRTVTLEAATLMAAAAKGVAAEMQRKGDDVKAETVLLGFYIQAFEYLAVGLPGAQQPDAAGGTPT